MDHKAWNWGQDKFYLRQVYLTKCYLWIIFINIQAIERYPKKKKESMEIVLIYLLQQIAVYLGNLFWAPLYDHGKILQPVSTLVTVSLQHFISNVPYT